MTKVAQRDLWQLRGLASVSEQPGVVADGQRCAVDPGQDEIGIDQRSAHRHALAEVSGPHRLQHGQFPRRNREITHRPSILRVTDHIVTVHVDPSLTDAQLALVEVEIGPP
ncbi:hypothetical protein LK459_17265 [Gordonia otitidis]|uniref:hypothetical protein n=1 Tax=Gordonia otitidis TaxID=249058 RepID=UPI001D14F0A8|nr:hypothetical protein [Gordonia otitidis]UEA58317.1 hypothetical protein LK459_17265 [Gordonia otitidis]